MESIHFNFKAQTENHECTAFRNGDWIIFQCPDCPNYERRINWRTGKMIIQNAKPNINHAGYYDCPEYRESLRFLN